MATPPPFRCGSRLRISRPTDRPARWRGPAFSGVESRRSATAEERFARGAMIRLRRTPTPSSSTSTTCPARRKRQLARPTPGGVPVRITSPGCKVQSVFHEPDPKEVRPCAPSVFARQQVSGQHSPEHHVRGQQGGLSDARPAELVGKGNPLVTGSPGLSATRHEVTVLGSGEGSL